MDVKQTIRMNLTHSDVIAQTYLKDLSDADLLSRPCDKANHIAWQLGHLIASEAYFCERVKSGSSAPLPAGFAERHKTPAAASDDPRDFLSRDEYLKLMQQARAATLNLLEGMSAADLDRPVEKLPPFLKTAGEALLFIGTHWTMHAGQWAVTRRALGKPPLF
jgi:uncharacterized damage-inducible protein DinB